MFSLLLALAIASHSKCTGSDYCTACKNCTSCKHCKTGKCGVCNGKKDTVEDDTCIRVVDGDTIVVMQEGKPVHVRMIGVDTPESVDPRKPVQAYAKEASLNTKKLVEGKRVKLIFDRVNKVDKYGRTLAYVYVDNVLINELIIREGFGHAYLKYPFDSQKMSDFRNAEREAREQQRGLWAP